MEQSIFQRRDDRPVRDRWNDHGSDRWCSTTRDVSRNQNHHRSGGMGWNQERNRGRDTGWNLERNGGRDAGWNQEHYRSRGASRSQNSNMNQRHFGDSGYRKKPYFRKDNSQSWKSVRKTLAVTEEDLMDKTKEGGPQPRKSVHERPAVTEEDLMDKTAEELEIIKTMGFSSFDTTKGRNIMLNFEFVEEDDW